MKAAGRIRHIGITQHDAARAIEAARSGLYETVQYPLSYLSSERDLAVVDACRENGVGFIAMKGMSGGLLSNAAAAHAYMRGLDIVVPIWGIEKMSELEDFLRYEAEGVEMNDALRADIEKDRAELTGSFCRGCGYCLPCRSTSRSASRPGVLPHEALHHLQLPHSGVAGPHGEHHQLHGVRPVRHPLPLRTQTL
jgi:aryl-alcohol dehydrogenase-like predicted oxidoreductase